MKQNTEILVSNICLLFMYLHFIIIHISHYVHIMLICSVTYDSLQPVGLQPARLLYPWNFLGKNTRLGFHFRLQGIFPGIESKSPAWQVDSLSLSHLGRLLQFSSDLFSHSVMSDSLRPHGLQHTRLPCCPLIYI